MKDEHCQKPDRDMPGIKCGYPLPCQHHTAMIDLRKNPPCVTQLKGLKLNYREREALKEIGKVLKDKV